MRFPFPSQHHNLRTLRAQPLAELSGSLGDLGTLLPLLIALALARSISLSTTLVFSGLANILTGLLFSLPLPVQPMKAIAAVAIARRYSIEENAAAGLFVGAVVAILSLTGLLGWLGRAVPIPVVKGIQVGAGLSLVISAGNSMLQPLSWTMPKSDNLVWALFAFLLLLVTTYVPWATNAKGVPRLPYALLVFLLGLTIALIILPSTTAVWRPIFHLWHPRLHVPSSSNFISSALTAGLGQLPLTTLNSIIAVTHLSSDLFPPPDNPAAPSPAALGLSVAVMNLVSCWFGSMPVCHGAGGLAAQHRFGARSGSSVIMLGLAKLVVGLMFAEDTLLAVLDCFPRALLGVMVLAAGVQLASAGEGLNAGARDLWVRVEAAEAEERHVSGINHSTSAEGVTTELKQRDLSAEERQRRWTVMLVTVGGLLAFRNDAVGFIAGLLCHWAYQAPEIVHPWWRRTSNVINSLQRQTRGLSTWWSYWRQRQQQQQQQRDIRHEAVRQEEAVGLLDDEGRR